MMEQAIILDEFYEIFKVKTNREVRKRINNLWVEQIRIDSISTTIMDGLWMEWMGWDGDCVGNGHVESFKT